MAKKQRPASHGRKQAQAETSCGKENSAYHKPPAPGQGRRARDAQARALAVYDGRQPLVRYDSLCRALAEAVAVDEVKDIRDKAIAMQAYAKQAKNRDMEADAVALRMRATRKLDQVVQAQKKTVGLATGGEHGGRRSKDGLRHNPSNARATLAMQGIDKTLAHQARTLGALSEQRFEEAVVHARDSVSRAYKAAINLAAIEQKREAYRARTYQGGTVDDLHALVASGFRPGVISVDFPWLVETWSEKGGQRSAKRHYETWPLDRILAFAPIIGQLAAKDCALLLWAIWPLLDVAASEVIKTCGFTYKTCGFIWVKTTPGVECITLDGDGLHTGMGLSGTRANTEVCLEATRGSPLRLSADVHQVIIAPVGEHSEKPEEVHRRIERLYPGPYLELFARRPVDGWTTWGNEIERGQMTQPADAWREMWAKPFDYPQSEANKKPAVGAAGQCQPQHQEVNQCCSEILLAPLPAKINTIRVRRPKG